MIVERRTRTAFIWTSILNTPFWAIFNLLPFILYKDLHATPLQITLMIVLKPAVSLIALYWSALVERRTDRLLPNLIWGRILSHLPFFLFPFIDNPWFFIFSFGLYMTLSRGTMPAWMEVLKLNLPGFSRPKIYAYGSSFAHLGSAVIPLCFASVMDSYDQSWRWIFPITALISISAVLLKARIPMDHHEKGKTFLQETQLSWKQQLIKPWKNSWELVSRRVDFARFQLGFMLGGAGLIIIQPILPVFFMDNLNLTYTELAAALTLCKAIGYVAASSTWANIMNKINLYQFNSWVTFIACLCPICFIAAQINLAWLYGGYLLYGVMQAGSEMSWHLSGPIFANHENSSSYSEVNLLTVGLRGCIFPILGSVLNVFLGVTNIMLIGTVLCLFSTICMKMYSDQIRRQGVLKK